MFLNYPYTDLYNLNLDWMIKAIKEVQETITELGTVVNTVNGMSGDVTLTKAFLTQLLDGVVNSVNGQTGAVVLTKEFVTGLLEHVVNTFNGRDGAVTLQAGDVNGLSIEIAYVSDPGESINDFSQAELDAFWSSGKRLLILLNNLGVPDRLYVLTLVGDVVTPQAYEPTAAQAGVMSINGESGALIITGSDLDTSDTDSTPIGTSISSLSGQIEYLEDISESSITTYSDNAISVVQNATSINVATVQVLYSDKRARITGVVDVTAPIAGNVSISIPNPFGKAFSNQYNSGIAIRQNTNGTINGVNGISASGTATTITFAERSFVVRNVSDYIVFSIDVTIDLQ